MAQDEPHRHSDSSLTGELKSYVDHVNELSEKRRVNVHLANQQSIFYGTQVGYVNTGRGNLSFMRRDMATVGRLPAVVARIFDSSSTAEGDFGPGWRLSATEVIEPKRDGSVVLVDDTATSTRFVTSGGSFVAERPHPTDVLELRQVDKWRFLVKLQTGLSKEYTLVDKLFHLTRVTDRNGNALTLQYTSGKLTRLQGENNRWINIERDGSGQVSSIADDQGRRVSYLYSSRGQLSEVRDLGGSPWRYSYNKSGQVREALDPLSQANFVVNYDAQGRVEKLQSPGKLYRYNYVGRRTTVTDGNGHTSVYVHNQDGITTGINNAQGVQTRIELDAGNRVHRLYRQAALQAQLEYDKQGRLISLVKYDAHKPEFLSYAYDNLGHLVEIKGTQDRLEFNYDAQGNLLERMSRTEAAKYNYSPQGDVMEMAAAEGRTVSFETDNDGQITSILDSQGQRTRFEYSPAGQLSRTYFADGSRQTYRYDRLGIRRATEFGDGRTTEYDRNAVGSFTSVRALKQNQPTNNVRIMLDEQQKVKGVKPLRGEEVSFAYDPMGNVLANRRGARQTRFEYDQLYRLTGVTTPDGRHLEYNYQEGEPDLRVQNDHHTGLNLSQRVTSGPTFMSGLELFKNRTQASPLGPVRYDNGMVDYRIATSDGVVLPDSVYRSTLERMHILELGQPNADKKDFSAPMNVMFTSAETPITNCCGPCGCVESPALDTDEGGTTDCEGGGGGGGGNTCTPTTLAITSPTNGADYGLLSSDYKSVVINYSYSTNGNTTCFVNRKSTFSYRTSGGYCSGCDAVNNTNEQYGFTHTVAYGGVGGRVTVTASIASVSAQPVTITVTGIAIPESKITDRLVSLYTAGATPRLLTGVAMVESTYRQFATRTLYGRSDLWPLESYDGGSHIGLMQVVPTMGKAYDWLQNTQEGLNIINSGLQVSRNYEASDRSAHPTLPALTSIQHEDNALSFYRLGTSTSQRYWVPSSSYTSWVVNTPNTTGVNYVSSVRTQIK